MTGAHSKETFKKLLQMNIIMNCPVSAEDVDNADKIWGSPIAERKGKNTCRKCEAVHDNLIEMPEELQDLDKGITLCINVMCVTGIPFLTTIDKTIKECTSMPLTDEEHHTIFEAPDAVPRHYNKANYLIDAIECDGAFKDIMAPVADELHVKMHYTNRKDHMPEVEHHVKTVKEQVRTMLHGLPYKAIPRNVMRGLVMQATFNLTTVPAKGGISDRYRPHVLLGRRNLDYKKHYQFEFGELVTVTEEPQPSNAMAA